MVLALGWARLARNSHLPNGKLATWFLRALSSNMMRISGDNDGSHSVAAMACQATATFQGSELVASLPITLSSNMMSFSGEADGSHPGVSTACGSKQLTRVVNWLLGLLFLKTMKFKDPIKNGHQE